MCDRIAYGSYLQPTKAPSIDHNSNKNDEATTMNHSKRTCIGLSILFSFATLCSVTPASAIEIFNVKLYGAIGDGKHDDTTAILKAITAASKQQGNIVEFPDGGNYLFSSSLPVSGIKLVGLQGSTLIAANNNIEVDVTGVGSEIRGLTFFPSVSGGVAISVRSGASKFVLFQNFFYSGFLRDIVILNASSGLLDRNLINVTPTLNGATGIALDQGSNNIEIEKNDVICTQLAPSSNTHGIQLDNCSRITLLANGLQKLSEAIHVFDSLDVTLKENTISSVQTGINGQRNHVENITSNSISGLTSISTGIQEVSGTSQTIEENEVSDVQTGLSIAHATKPRILGNKIRRVTGTALALDTSDTVLLDDNEITGATQAIYMFAPLGATVNANRIQTIQGVAIQSLSARGGTTDIARNEITDAGLAQGPKLPAVIYVDSPAASQIIITQNTYKGASAHLQYYIWCKQGPPKALVSGNKTTTTLPSRVGS